MNNDLIYLYTRNNNPKCGLCSYIWTIFALICDDFNLSLSNNKFIIDFSNYYYYLLSDKNNLSKNWWNDYFYLPYSFDNNEILRQVKCYNPSISLYPNKFDIKIYKDLFKKFILPKTEFIDIANKYIKDNNLYNAIGILIRRTDYNEKLAKFQYRLPEIDQIVTDINIIREKYSINLDSTKIFLMSEITSIIDELKNKLNINNIFRYLTLNLNDIINLLLLCGDYLDSKPYTFKYLLNSEYLISLLIMSKLKYLLVGNTSASSILKYMITDNTLVFKLYDLGRF